MEIERGDIEVIREVFAYINRFRGKAFVIKIDNDIIDYEYFPVLLKDLSILHQAGIRIIIVPGARNRIDEILNQYNINSSFHNGIRITDSEMISFVKMAAFDVSNKIMTALSGNNVNALVGNWVKAKSIGIVDGVDYLNSGAVEKIQKEPLLKVMENSFVPIFPCIGWNANGKPYNISSDDLAISISELIGAEKLFFISSNPVLKSDKYNFPANFGVSYEGRISRIKMEIVDSFLDLNKNKIEELDSIKRAKDAVSRGVHRVHLLNGKTKGSLLEEIFSNLGVGTMIYGNEFEKIRKMEDIDISGVLRIMEPFVKDGTLLIRDKQFLLNQIDSFFIYETDSVIHGCASLVEYPEGFGEIAAVAVDQNYIKLGIGSKLIKYLLDRAVKKKIKKVFVLTTRTSDWFETIGFRKGELSDIPVCKQEKYDFNRNSKIYIYNPEIQ
ncbi:MAG: amino-acid N-acetyltransferase [Spirochaetia bacterium]|jgi:amino-acid N-acetyltransferase|nr:amino-acid N-acetyltransferase [Spirochaetia bacterium]